MQNALLVFNKNETVLVKLFQLYISSIYYLQIKNVPFKQYIWHTFLRHVCHVNNVRIYFILFFLYL